MISHDSIRLVRSKASIKDVINDSVKLRRAGGLWKGLCPFHAEKTPSFTVNEARQSYVCYGCGEHGGIIDFVMKSDGLSFPEAIHEIACRFSVDIEMTDDEPGDRERQAQLRSRREAIYSALRIACAYFEAQLRDHADAHVARDHLAKVRDLPLDGPEAVQAALAAFRIGYAPTMATSLHDHLRANGISLEIMQAADLAGISERSQLPYDRFRHRLMFPILDTQGRVVGFSGRVLPHPVTGEITSTQGKYVNSKETDVYRKGHVVFGLFQARTAIRRVGEALVVEGNLDVVALHARGILHAVAPLGTAMTSDHAEEIRRYAPRVALFFDGDAAGTKAVSSAREPCRGAGLITRVAALPNGHDPDSFIRAHGAQAVLDMVKGGQGILEHLLRQIMDRATTVTDSQERAQVAREVLDLLAGERDPIVRGMARSYAEQIATHFAARDDKTGQFDAETFLQLRHLGERNLAKSTGSAGLVAILPGVDYALHPRVGDPLPPMKGTDLTAQAVLGALLDFPELLDASQHEEGFAAMEGDVAIVIDIMREETRGDGGLFAAGIEPLLDRVPSSLKSFVAERATCPQYQDLAAAEEALASALNAVQVRHLSIEGRHLLYQIAIATQSGDQDREMDLLRKAQECARSKHGYLGKMRDKSNRA